MAEAICARSVLNRISRTIKKSNEQKQGLRPLCCGRNPRSRRHLNWENSLNAACASPVSSWSLSFWLFSWPRCAGHLPLYFRCSRGVAVRRLTLQCSAGAEPRGYARCRRVRGHDWPTMRVFVSTTHSPFRRQGMCRSHMQTQTILYPMRPGRRVVVTGLGAVTPLGNSVPEFWSNVVATVLQPTLFLHFVLTFPEKREIVRRRPWLQGRSPRDCWR